MTTNNNGYFSEYNYKPGRNQIETGPPYNFVASNFGVQPQFEEFDYDNNRMSGASNPPEYNGNSLAYYSSHHSYSRYLLASGNIPATGAYSYTNRSFDDYEDDPPLMEELGINLDHILHKTVAVLNPLKETDSTIVQDADLSGPFVFCLIFGTFLLFSGKLHFGYMYGIGMLGCIAMYALLNLMSDSGVSIGCTISVLGYCLLPMVVLSGLSILSLRGMMGTFLSVFTVLWCSLSASKLFVTALDMDHQQLLIAYPCALLYGIFALLTVF